MKSLDFWLSDTGCPPSWQKRGELIYGQSEYKDPDLLVFNTKLLNSEEKSLLEDKALTWQERHRLDSAGKLASLLRKAVIALEVEFSPYKAREMKNRNWFQKPIWNGKNGN